MQNYIPMCLKNIKYIYTNKLPISDILTKAPKILYLFEILQLKSIDFNKTINIVRIFTAKIKHKKILSKNIRKGLSTTTFDNKCSRYTALRVVNYIISVV